MGEILPRHYIIGIIFFVFFIMGIITLINEFDNADPNFMDSNDEDDFAKFNATFNQLDKINKTVSAIETSVEVTPVSLEATTFGVLNSLINSAWNTLKLLTQSLSFMNVVFHGLSSIFGIPTWVSTLITLLVVVIIMFAIYSAIFQTQV